MLLSFKIENFRSIKSLLEIDFTTEKRLNEDDLPNNSFIENGNEILKSVVLYGRNASGKSNVLLALKALAFLIVNSEKTKHGESIPTYEAFKFDVNYRLKPTIFDVDFIGLKSRIRYSYRIVFTAEKFLSEDLFFYPEGTKAKLYSRKESNISYGDYYKGTKKKIEDDLLPNQLFLSKASTSNVKYLDEIYLFFSKYFFVSILHDVEYDRSIIRGYSEMLKGDKNLKSNLLHLLKAADTSITDFSIKESAKDFNFAQGFPEKVKKEILDSYKYEVLTNHDLFENDKVIGSESLMLENESLGTQKLFTVGSLILDTLNEGGLIAIDELDKGLHPLLTKLLIKLFNSKKNNPKNAQLILATHDSTLLDTEIFRRDQICFIDKDYQGASTFYKLSDIKGVRKDIPIDKWYLSGRFKAIPVLTDVELNF